MWTITGSEYWPPCRYSTKSGCRTRLSMRRPRSARRESSSSSPALRLNQTISPCGSSMTTPSGMAAVERRSSRNRRVSRSLWNRLRRCRRTTCATTSPQRPIASGGSATLRCCSQNHNARSCQRFHARYSVNAPLTPIHTEPANHPSVAPSANASSTRSETYRKAVVPESMSLRSEGTRGEAVTRAAHRLDQPVVAEFFQCLAQPADVYVDGTFLDIHVSAPDAIQQLLACVHALRMRHEEREHAVLRGPQSDGAFTGADALAA